MGSVLRCIEQIISYYETAYPPFKRHRLAQIGNVLMNVGDEYMTQPRLGTDTESHSGKH
jgi:hypothetical protein